VRRTWRPGDTVVLSMPMKAFLVAAHPYVAEDLGRVAMTRGPLVYCFEQADNPGVELRDVVVPVEGAVVQASFREELLGGVTVLRSEAELRPPGGAWEGRLYRLAGEGVAPRGPASDGTGRHAVEVTAVPYYAWANREPGRMTVWVRRR